MSSSILKNNSITIVTTKYGLSIANNLANELIKLNFKVKIIENSENIIFSDEILYIILFSFLLNKLPKKYIIYQLEQIGKSIFLSDKLYTDIENAVTTFDYSHDNCFNINEKYKKYVQFQPMPITDKIIKFTFDTKVEYLYDVFFFGSINKRRNDIIDYLIKSDNKIRVGYTSDTFYTSLYEYVKKTKIVLNLHYYDNAILETARLNELLPLNTIIISESTQNKETESLYSDDIVFIDTIKNNLSNIHLLTNQINNCLINFNLLKLNLKHTRPDTIQNLYNKFSSTLKKNLLEANIIIN